ncbi:MAG: putative RNA-binding protein with PIN domain [Limisphaerales bacterium]|jgi:predicted RNA-binding protein with PIN domain
MTRVGICSLTLAATFGDAVAKHFDPGWRCRHSARVPILRILVDGYSLLHAWPRLASHAERHTAEARDALVHVLTQYRDSVGTPVTVFFDGGGAPPGTPKTPSDPEMEIIYSPSGKTADDLIERVAYKLAQLGEVLVVTDDHAERDMITSFGGMPRGCEEFILDVNAALQDLTDAVKIHNRREKSRYHKSDF